MINLSTYRNDKLQRAERTMQIRLFLAIWKETDANKAVAELLDELTANHINTERWNLGGLIEFAAYKQHFAIVELLLAMFPPISRPHHPTVLYWAAVHQEKNLCIKLASHRDLWHLTLQQLKNDNQAHALGYLLCNKPASHPFSFDATDYPVLASSRPQTSSWISIISAWNDSNFIELSKSIDNQSLISLMTQAFATQNQPLITLFALYAEHYAAIDSIEHKLAIATTQHSKDALLAYCHYYENQYELLRQIIHYHVEHRHIPKGDAKLYQLLVETMSLDERSVLREVLFFFTRKKKDLFLAELTRLINDNYQAPFSADSADFYQRGNQFLKQNIMSAKARIAHYGLQITQEKTYYLYSALVAYGFDPIGFPRPVNRFLYRRDCIDILQGPLAQYMSSSDFNNVRRVCRRLYDVLSTSDNKHIIHQIVGREKLWREAAVLFAQQKNIPEILGYLDLLNVQVQTHRVTTPMQRRYRMMKAIGFLLALCVCVSIIMLVINDFERRSLLTEGSTMPIVFGDGNTTTYSNCNDAYARNGHQCIDIPMSIIAACIGMCERLLATKQSSLGWGFGGILGSAFVLGVPLCCTAGNRVRTHFVLDDFNFKNKLLKLLDNQTLNNQSTIPHIRDAINQFILASKTTNPEVQRMISVLKQDEEAKMHRIIIQEVEPTLAIPPYNAGSNRYHFWHSTSSRDSASERSNVLSL